MQFLYSWQRGQKALIFMGPNVCNHEAGIYGVQKKNEKMWECKKLCCSYGVHVIFALECNYKFECMGVLMCSNIRKQRAKTASFGNIPHHISEFSSALMCNTLLTLFMNKGVKW